MLFVRIILKAILLISACGHFLGVVGPLSALGYATTLGMIVGLVLIVRQEVRGK